MQRAGGRVAIAVAAGTRRTYHSPPRARSPFLVLALESSADDTCCAIVQGHPRKILANVVVKQDKAHQPYGGIHPLLALREHQRNMPGAIQTALTQARVTMADLDAIAFTRGPGMLSCLTVASVAARSLAAALDKPLVGVHHMQAHALTPFLTEDVPPEFPFLTLLVSGGHTLIALARSSSQFELLATTRDNAIGEAIDHVARLLAVPWMGSPGSALERFAASARELPGFDCPDFRSHPTKENKARFGYFSFSGLKSSVQRFVSEQGGTDALSEDQRKVIAQRFQSTAIMQLERTLAVTLADLTIKPTALVVSGGVASNALLRNRLRECLDGQGRTETRLIFPPVALCTDNAAMIAWTAIDRLKRGFHTDSLAVASHPVWSIESCESGGPV